MTAPFTRRVEIATDFLNSIGSLDFEEVGRHLADDAIMALPFLDDLPALHGKSAIVDQLRNTIPHLFRRMDFTFDQWYNIRESDAVIAEYHSEAIMLASDNAYRNSYITVFRFDGDRISLYREYLNPAKMTDLISSPDI
ncbi:nuclear transport factor 2 family protein [Mycolicibacterium diernhoferi]|uniref:SnoaL-like domain-containing protein n=1 Tax=Mycolicibacterium diernhoferi TaxID=1801 RepID=A0A1Q4HLU6_9MYCO|nr:nuclear transport factor 2 family protein [Mycolicibacterium diernhoferi]OJZ68371.1 hypothetical protein BRW64_01965 [Mycolicibacterium diernhoferi]OPE45588.1 hypothetical protein BV510_27815 [Mycolicibacterium diernhoferi]QYL21130.1 nuclear transport factor 2 family protein [Mycolicibacterium diernhoferi]